jgi:CRP-like cAMP-binding protein
VVDRSLLTEVELFDELETADIDQIATAAESRSLQRGDVLFSEGEEAAELFVVADGRIAISNKSIDGRESMMALMERGDLFGEMPLFDGLSRSAEACFLEPSSVIAIPYAPPRTSTASSPNCSWTVVALLAGRLRTTDAAPPTRSFLDVTGRTAKRLPSWPATPTSSRPGSPRSELAGMVGASRERVNKAIASFIRLGWIEQIDRRYRITNREQLTRRAR